MKRLGFGLVLMGAWMAVPARADDASKRAKVVELFQVMHVNRMTEQITDSVHKQMELSMRSVPGAGNMNAEQKRLLEEYEGKVMAIVKDNMSWTVLEPQMVALYSSTYSEGEIDGILAFYKGAVGQSLLAKTPELTEKSMALTSGKLVTLQPQISAMSQEFVRKYEAAAGAPAKAGTGSTGASAAPK